MDNWATFGMWVMAAYAAVATLVVLSAALRKFRRVAPSTIAAAMFFASIASVVAQKGGGTNGVSNLPPQNMSPQMALPRPASPGVISSGFSPTTLHFQLSTLNSPSGPRRMTAVEKVAKINARGAWRDSFRLDFEDGFVFPFGTNHLSSVEVFTQGYVRPRRKSAEVVADIGSRVAIVPGLTELSLEHTLSNSYRIAWTDAAVDRDTNALVTASVELFRSGDVAVATNGVTTLTPRVLPFAHDGFGQDDEWVAANFTNATEILSQGYAQWVDAQVGSGLTNGLYKFTVTISNTPPETVQLVVGEYSVAVTNAGEYVFLLEKGTRYTVGFSPLPYGVGYAWDDGEEASQNAPLMLRGAVNSPTYTVRLTSSGDDGSGVEFVEPRQDADGCIVWCPYMTVSPECVDDPAFPVLLVAIVQDLPLGASASVTWWAAGRTLATGDSFLWDGDEEDVDSISIEALFRDVELHGSVSIERHVRQSEIEIAGGGMIVLEDGYTNTPNDVVAASSTSTDIRLSWALAQDGTLSLDSGCSASFSLATEGGSPVSLPLEWQGCRDDEDGMTLRATGLGAGAGGTVTFTFTPDDGGATLSRTIPLQVVKIRVEAVADWPSNKVRHVFGPMEQFRIVCEPSGMNLTAVAPIDPGCYSCSIGCGELQCDVQYNVISPTAIRFEFVRDMTEADWMDAGRPALGDDDVGVGFVSSMFLEPSTVSFANIFVQEGTAPMFPKSGCFLDEDTYNPELFSHTVSNGAETPVAVGDFNKIGDVDYAALRLEAVPASNGTYMVIIPVSWGAAGGPFDHALGNVIQSFSVDSNGTTTVSKGGITRTRSIQ